MRNRNGSYATALAALALIVTPPAAAQLAIPTDDALMQRQVRAIELRAASDPTGAAADASRLRRDQLDRSSGALPSSETLRLDRRLQQIERVGQQPAAMPPRLRLPPSGLTPSYDGGYRGNPERESDPLALVDGLLSRATESITEGRLASARSDLVAADRELAAARGTVADAALAGRQQRLARLNGEVGAP